MEFGEILSVILGSSLITSVITNMFFRWKTNKKIVVNNIIKERKEWRGVVYKIADKINMATTKEELQIQINLLKLNLNAYGYNNHTEHIKDGYLWNIISIFEKDNCINSQKLNIYKRAFIAMVSLLLKYDWEKSKMDIYGNQLFNSIAIANICCGILAFMGTLFKHTGSVTGDFDIYRLSCFIIFIVLVDICAYFSIGKVVQFVFYNFKFCFFQISMILATIFWVFTTIDAISLTGFTIKLVGEEYDVAVKFLTLGMIVSGLILIMYLLKLYLHRKNYKEAIEQVESSFGEEIGVSAKK